MSVSFRHRSLVLAGLTSILLTACGGGSGGDGGGVTGNTVQADAVDKFVGSWVSVDCTSDDDVTQKINDVATPTRLRDSVVITKSSTTQLNLRYVSKYYAQTDTNCSGTPVLTITRTGENLGKYTMSGSEMVSSYGLNTLSYVDSKMIDGVSADRLNLSVSQLVPITSTTFTTGSLTLKARIFRSGQSKAIAKIDNNKLVIAGDSDNFPVDFTKSIAYVKQ